MAQLNPQKLPAYNALISGTGFVSADVIPLTNYDGLAVCILDGNGNQITTFGGGGSGTQYTYGTVNTTPIGTVAFGQTPSNVLQSLSLDSSGNLKVNIASGSSSGVQYADDVASGATPTGTLGMGWDSINAVVRALKVDTTQNLYVNVSNFPSTQNVNIQNSSIAVTGTFWQATQPVSISGTVATSSAQLPAALDGSGNLKVAVENSPSVSVSNFPSTQPISGTIAVSNFPSTQAVTGTFWQTTQPVSGSVSVSNFPATQAVSWSGQSVAVTGTVTVSGTVASTQSGTWTNTVTQATGTNLHAVIDSGSVTITGTPAISGTVTANQGTANTAANAWPTAISVSGAAIDPRQIRALTSADVVSLPTAQVTTLTPPTAAAIGTAVATPTAAAIASAIVANPPTTPLPSAQITTLTPPTAAAIGTAVAAPTASAIGTAVASDLLTGTQLASASVPVALPTATITTLTPPTASAIGTAVAGALTNPLPVHDSAPASQAVTNAGTFAVQATIAAQGTPVAFGTAPTGTGGTASTYATTGCSSPSAVAIDGSGNAWIAGNASLIQMSPTGSILQTITPVGNLRGIAIDTSGNIWVADNSAPSIIEYSSAGALLNTYTTSISSPRSIAFDGYGNLWVPSSSTNTVTKLSSAGAVLGVYTLGSGNFFGLAIDSFNNVWINDNSANTVLKLNNSGVLLGTFPVGTNAESIAIDQSGNAWVANSGSDNVTLLSPQGVVLATFDLPVGGHPQFIAIDSHGNAWVTDYTGSNTVHVLSPTGVLLASYATGASPYAIAIDASGNAWVTNLTATSISKIAGYALPSVIGTNAALFSGNTPITNTYGALNVNVLGSTITPISATTALNTKTNPISVSQTDGTNVITAAISALGTAPTGTFVETVNAVNLPSAASGASCTLFSNSTVTTAVVAKASAGNLYGCLVNGGTSGNFLQFINASSAPALGTAPVFSIQIPASGIISIPPGVFALDNFTSGISVGISTTYNGASAGTAASVVLFYK